MDDQEKRQEELVEQPMDKTQNESTTVEEIEIEEMAIDGICGVY